MGRRRYLAFLAIAAALVASYHLLHAPTPSSRYHALFLTLGSNARAAALVDKLQDNGVFFDHFKNSIKRMGQIGVLTGASGQIRNKCNVVNS